MVQVKEVLYGNSFYRVGHGGMIEKLGCYGVAKGKFPTTLQINVFFHVFYLSFTRNESKNEIYLC